MRRRRRRPLLTACVVLLAELSACVPDLGPPADPAGITERHRGTVGPDGRDVDEDP